MTDETTDDETPAVDPALAALLADPALWAAPDPSVEEALVAAIGATPAPRPGPERSRSWMPVLAAAAVVVVVGVGLAIVFSRGDEGDGRQLALAATDVAPEATASVLVSETPLGTKLLLEVVGLPPAPAGTYYEAWLRKDPDLGVSAGTFHLRGGDGAIELWAGVSTDEFPLITVTLQDEAESASSGVVVLRGLLDDEG